MAHFFPREMKNYLQEYIEKVIVNNRKKEDQDQEHSSIIAFLERMTLSERIETTTLFSTSLLFGQEEKISK